MTPFFLPDLREAAPDESISTVRRLCTSQSPSMYRNAAGREGPDTELRGVTRPRQALQSCCSDRHVATAPLHSAPNLQTFRPFQGSRNKMQSLNCSSPFSNCFLLYGCSSVIVRLLKCVIVAHMTNTTNNQDSYMTGKLFLLPVNKSWLDR